MRIIKTINSDPKLNTMLVKGGLFGKKTLGNVHWGDAIMPRHKGERMFVIVTEDGKGGKVTGCASCFDHACDMLLQELGIMKLVIGK